VPFLSPLDGVASFTSAAGAGLENGFRPFLSSFFVAPAIFKRQQKRNLWDFDIGTWKSVAVFGPGWYPRANHRKASCLPALSSSLYRSSRLHQLARLPGYIEITASKGVGEGAKKKDGFN
jgi:hypothetical protein